LIFDLYKNRELKWNVKDKDAASREMDAACALIDAGYWAGEPCTPPEISGGACFRFGIRRSQTARVFPFFA
jgi:hypothetical protein